MTLERPPVRTRTPVVLRRLAWSALVLQMLLVVTGAAVRLTGSGLGCPTWPRCTGTSLTNTHALGVHGYIEFGNRLLGVLMEVVGILLVVAVRRYAPQWTRLAVVQPLFVPVQALIGGVLVLSDLNPWVLIVHFLASFPLVYAAAVLLHRVLDPDDGPPQPLVATLSVVALLATVAVLLAGTVVTGSGPHAGDPKVDRLPFQPQHVSQLHADLVWLLVGLVVALLVVTREPLRRWAWLLAGLVVAQGALGYWQYAHAIPALAVGFHVTGAVLIFTTAGWLQLSARRTTSAAA